MNRSSVEYWPVTLVKIWVFEEVPADCLASSTSDNTSQKEAAPTGELLSACSWNPPEVDVGGPSPPIAAHIARGSWSRRGKSKRSVAVLLPTNPKPFSRPVLYASTGAVMRLSALFHCDETVRKGTWQVDLRCRRQRSVTFAATSTLGLGSLQCTYQCR